MWRFGGATSPPLPEACTFPCHLPTPAPAPALPPRLCRGVAVPGGGAACPGRAGGAGGAAAGCAAPGNAAGAQRCGGDGGGSGQGAGSGSTGGDGTGSRGSLSRGAGASVGGGLSRVNLNGVTSSVSCPQVGVKSQVSRFAVCVVSSGAGTACVLLVWVRGRRVVGGGGA